MNVKSALVSVATVGLLVGATGCSSSSNSTASEPSDSTADSTSPSTSSMPKDSMKPSASKATEQQAAAVITIQDFEFSGPDSVAPGAEVMVNNDDTTSHTVTAEGDGGFDVTIAGGETATFTAPSQPGSYPYVCNFHGDMTGTLVVK